MCLWRWRAAQAGDDAAAGSQLAKIAVPENLAAIIDHYIVKLTSDQRSVLSAAAVCGIGFCIDTISGALERDAVWVGQTCDELAREQLWLVAPHAEGGPAWPDDVCRSFRFCSDGRSNLTD